MRQNQAELWLAQNLAYTFLSKVFYEAPTLTFIQALVENDLFADWPFDAEDTTSQEALIQLRVFTEEWTEDSLLPLKRDYARLFVGPGRLLAHPWESVYRGTDGILFDVQTLEVRAFYQQFGMAIPKVNIEPDDHFGLEMRFIAYLSALALSALEQGDVATVERIAVLMRRFLDGHVLQWHDRFLTAVCQNAQTGFYRAIAQLALGCLQITDVLLKESKAIPAK